MVEEGFEEVWGIVKNVDREGKWGVLLIMLDRWVRMIEGKTKGVGGRKSVKKGRIW